MKKTDRDNILRLTRTLYDSPRPPTVKRKYPEAIKAYQDIELRLAS